VTIQVLQRDDWRGDARHMGDAFLLKKGSRTATCGLWSHPFGWELRLHAAGELFQTQVCRSQDDVFSTLEAWKAAMIEKGWTT
jgi:hypothetical protein